MKPLFSYAVLAFLSLLFMVGCSSSEFRDRASDYHLAQPVTHPLPEEFNQRDSLPIPVPERGVQALAGEVPRPDPLRVVTADSPLVEQRADEEAAWLLVQRSPAEVWPSLQSFAEEQDLPIQSRNPRRGEITWEADAASDLPAQKISLRQGVRRGTAEIRLRSFDAEENLAFSDYDRTRLMALEQYLNASLPAGNQGISQQAQSLHLREQVRLVDRDERQVLVLRLEFDRAWSELARVLENHFDEDMQQLQDFDRSEGRFYVRYVPEADRPSGFFARLFRRGPADDAHHYQLYLSEYKDELDLILETKPGQAAPEDVESEVLRWVERQLR